jgi:hypothetical protein
MGLNTRSFFQYENFILVKNIYSIIQIIGCEDCNRRRKVYRSENRRLSRTTQVTADVSNEFRQNAFRKPIKTEAWNKLLDARNRDHGSWRGEFQWKVNTCKRSDLNKELEIPPQIIYPFHAMHG